MFVNNDINQIIASRKAKSLSQLKMEMNLEWLNRKNYQIINTVDKLEPLIKYMENAPLLGVDTETTGIMIGNLSKNNPLKDRMVGMSISWERDQAIYIPFEHVLFNNIDKRKAFKLLIPILENCPIVTHNGLFDGKVFYDEGIRLNITQDTMLLYFNLDSRVSKGNKGLKPLTEKRYNYQVIELSDIFSSQEDYGLFRYLPEDLVRAYACADADHTLQLFMDSIGYLNMGQKRSYLFDVKIQNELVRSEYYGKGINMDLCRIMNEINNKDLERVRSLIFNYVGTVLSNKQGKRDYNSIYKFSLTSNSEVAHVMFDLLEYPIKKVSKKSGAPVLDKFVLSALSREGETSSDGILEKLMPDDLMSDIVNHKFDWVQKKNAILIKREKVLECKYKVAFLLTVYRKLEKYRSSFFAPLLNNNYEGRYYSPISMTNAETGRLIDPFQTLAGSLKRMIIPYNPEKDYMIDYDYAQIEYRVMVGQAGVKSVVEQLNNPEADYHRIGGSLILNKPPEDITGAERKSLKKINFGIPYGISAYGIMKGMYGIGLSKEDSKKHLAEIKELLDKWYGAFWQIKDMLNSYRDKALQPLREDELPEPLKGKKIGRIQNPAGRTRSFDLEELNPQKESSIRRMAGNFPIQSWAREVFCHGWMNLCERLKREGLMDKKVPDSTQASGYRFENKVVIMGYIHDECLMSISKDVSFKYMYRLISEECMIHLKGHPAYYCGVSVVTNWYEGHAEDQYEAPVAMVQEIEQTNPECKPDYTGEPRDIALAMIDKYIHKRALEEILRIYPSVKDTHFVDASKLMSVFKNYFVKPKMVDFVGTMRKPDKDANWDDVSLASAEKLLTEVYRVIKVRYPDGRLVEIKKLDSDFRYSLLEKENEEEEFADMVEDYENEAESEKQIASEIDIQNIAKGLSTIFQRIENDDFETSSALCFKQ